MRDDAIEQAGESFRDEALRMRALPQHDNVCRFLGVAVKPFAIVTRFCALGALERIVYKRQRAGAAFRLDLTPEFVQRTLLGVARGLVFPLVCLFVCSHIVANVMCLCFVFWTVCLFALASLTL